MNTSEILSPAGFEKQISLSRWRSNIINTIIRDGLKPGAALGDNYLSSCDDEPCKFVSGRYIVPTVSWKPGKADSERYYIEEEDLFNALYSSGESIIPVLTERKHELSLLSKHKEKGRMDLLNRTPSSFLVVSEDKNQNTFRSSFIERKDSLPPSEFSYLIFPQGIWNDYQTNFSTGNFTIAVKITDSMIKRSIISKSPYFLVENIIDYEIPLQEIMGEVRKPIWVHGVRLPTQEDLKFLSPQITDSSNL